VLHDDVVNNVPKHRKRRYSSRSCDQNLEVTLVGLHDEIPFPETVIDGKTYFHAISNANYRVYVKPLGSFATGVFPLDTFRVELWLDGKLISCIGLNKDKHMDKSTGEFYAQKFGGFVNDGIRLVLNTINKVCTLGISLLLHLGIPSSSPKLN